MTRPIPKPFTLAWHRWRLESRSESQRAHDRAKARLKVGDRIQVERCGGAAPTYTMTGWDGHWITSASRDDLAPISVIRVNGKPVTFRDQPDYQPASISSVAVFRDWLRRRWALACSRVSFWRFRSLPHFRWSNLTTCDDWFEAEGRALSIRWRSFIVEFQFARARGSEDDDVPF